VTLRKYSTSNECHDVYVCQNYRLPPGMQAEAPVSIILSNMQTDLET